MSEPEFNYMWDAVNEICRSLEEEPHRWVFDVNKFHKTGTKTQYWLPVGLDCINEIWDGRNTRVVFSVEQGAKIFKAYKVARSSQANTNQKRIISEVLVKPIEREVYSSWWKFWRKDK